MSTRIYFGYGSNMWPAQMRRRCPQSRPLGKARLEDWQFYLTVRGTASIRQCEGAEVWGVLWRLDPADIHRLDVFEGVHWHNYYKRSLVVDGPSGKFAAFSYVSRRRAGLRSRTGYMESTVLPGGRLNGLPEGYLEELRTFTNPRRTVSGSLQYRLSPRRLL